MKIHKRGDIGAYASYGPAVIPRAVVHANGPYYVPNVDIMFNLITQIIKVRAPMFRRSGDFYVGEGCTFERLARELGKIHRLRIKNAARGTHSSDRSELTMWVLLIP